MDFAKKLFNKVREISLISCTIKVAIIALTIIGGFFWYPLMLVALIFSTLFICLEFDVNSIYIVLFILPFKEVFNYFILPCWKIVLCAYIIILSIKTIYKFISKKLSFDWKILIVFLSLFAYFCMPYGGYLYGAKWLALFYLLITNRNHINSKLIFNFLLWGVLLSCFIGLFANKISFINDNIRLYYENGYARYSALFNNPNTLYPFIITSIAIIFVNVLLKKIHLLNIIYILPLVAFGFATISKTFLICLVIFLILAGLTLLIKPNKHKLIVVGSLLICCILGALIVFGHTSTLFSRLNTQDSADLVQDSNLNNSEYNKLLTGRLAIWKEYVKHYFSSAKSILLGNGLSSCVSLDIGGCHSSIIQLFYDFGLIGALLVLVTIVYLPLHLGYFKTKWLTPAFLPLIVTLMPMIVETIFLADNWSCLIILCVLVLYINIKPKDNLNKPITDKNNLNDDKITLQTKLNNSKQQQP